MKQKSWMKSVSTETDRSKIQLNKKRAMRIAMKTYGFKEDRVVKLRLR